MEGGKSMARDNQDFMDALEVIAREKGLTVETLLESLANALVAAYKRMPGAADEAYVEIDPDSGEIRVFGQELDEDGNVVREWEDTPKDFGRIAAQTAKQVMFQKIRDAERDLKYEEYAGREGDVVTGVISQMDTRFTLLDLGKIEAIMPHTECPPNERYSIGQRIKAYIVEVRKTAKGPQIVVSRTHPGLVKRLFELEVPEIASGVVEIKAIAREPGHRSKVAVWSNDDGVDPVGACVGSRGSRVRMVTNELMGEKLDIVPFSEDLVEYLERAIQPAYALEVRIDESAGAALIVVGDDQLSLAIGREGQNARLAARLSGLHIDVRAESEVAALDREAAYADDADERFDADGEPESLSTESLSAESLGDDVTGTDATLAADGLAPGVDVIDADAPIDGEESAQQ